jgi:hypothetical protein
MVRCTGVCCPCIGGVRGISAANTPVNKGHLTGTAKTSRYRVHTHALATARVVETYDFDSVMHYGQYAFSRCDPNAGCTGTPRTTIDVKPAYSVWQNLIGQRTHLSDLDELTMSFLYPESDWRFVDQAYIGGTENGTFLEPYKQFTSGASAVPSEGTVWVQPGTYSAVGTCNKTMTLRAPLGHVTLGP